MKGRRGRAPHFLLPARARAGKSPKTVASDGLRETNNNKKRNSKTKKKKKKKKKKNFNAAAARLKQIPGQLGFCCIAFAQSNEQHAARC